MIGITNCLRKDIRNMSFVGIHNTDEGLIAFADSKATIKYNIEGKMFSEDVNRGRILKIFKNNQFICVTHGNNELFCSYRKQRIEDYFKKNLQIMLTIKSSLKSFFMIFLGRGLI